jgi:hypothetical protein
MVSDQIDKGVGLVAEAVKQVLVEGADQARRMGE